MSCRLRYVALQTTMTPVHDHDPALHSTTHAQTHTHIRNTPRPHVSIHVCHKASQTPCPCVRLCLYLCSSKSGSLSALAPWSTGARTHTDTVVSTRVCEWFVECLTVNEVMYPPPPSPAAQLPQASPPPPQPHSPMHTTQAHTHTMVSPPPATPPNDATALMSSPRMSVELPSPRHDTGPHGPRVVSM